MSFKPLGDRVLLRRKEAAEKTSGGIILTESAKESPSEGEVVEVGTGVRDVNGNIVPMSVKKGDNVMFSKWSGTEIKVNDTDLLVIDERDIIGIFN